MGKNPSVIQINGNHYDVITGQLLGKPGPVIDGFRRPANLAPKFSQAVKPHLGAAKKHLTKPAQTVHQGTQRSKTLMRGIVAKPVATKRQPKTTDAIRASSANISPARVSKAMGIAKSHSVKRFGNPIKSHRLVGQGPVAHPRSSGGGGKVSAVAVQAAPAMITSVSHQRLERMLDEALLKADAHKQALKGRTSGRFGLRKYIGRAPRWMVVSAAVVIFTLAASFFAWRNVPEVSLKVASMQAKIHGSVPAYVPTGFKFTGPIKYNQGQLKMTYKDEAGSGSYTITQQPSNMDSRSLEDNSAPSDTQVQTSQVKGSTVFYDAKNNASWVNGGIHYTIIQNGAKLNADDLGKIAGSF